MALPFGARYGLAVRRKYAAIEAVQRRRQPCPACSKRKAARIAPGIYVCRACGARFAGKAWTA